MERHKLAANIRQHRLEAGITQRAAARHAGVSEHTWRRYEDGATTPRSWRLPNIANALDIPLGALFNPNITAEIHLSPQTAKAIDAGGQQALDDAIARLAEALRAPLRQAAIRAMQRPAELRPKAGQSLSPQVKARRAAEAAQRYADAAAKRAAKLSDEAAIA